MSEPYLTTREMVERIERDVAAMRADVHAMQLEMASSSATDLSVAAEEVAGRAKAAIWVAAGSSVAALVAAVVAIVKR